TVGDVDPDFLNEASFRTNSVQITDQKHFEQHDRIDARTPIILTIQGAAFFRDKRKVDGFIDFSKQVILGNKVFYVDCFGLKFPGWVRPEHIKTFLRNCFIPNSTKKAVDPSLSTASNPAEKPLGFLLPFWERFTGKTIMVAIQVVNVAGLGAVISHELRLSILLILEVGAGFVNAVPSWINLRSGFALGRVSQAIPS